MSRQWYNQPLKNGVFPAEIAVYSNEFGGEMLSQAPAKFRIIAISLRGIGGNTTEPHLERQ